MKKYKCLCCGYRTLDSRSEYDICQVCFWEDDAYLYVAGEEIKVLEHDMDATSDTYNGEDVLDIESGANHGLTLRQGRENYKRFGACEEEMIPHVRKPRREEMDKST